MEKSIEEKLRERPPPDWLYKLNDGIYTLFDVEKLSDNTLPEIIALMKKFATKITFVVEKNEQFAQYHWDKKYFSNKAYREIIEELSKQEPAIAQATKILLDLSNDPKEKAAYEARKKNMA